MSSVGVVSNQKSVLRPPAAGVAAVPMLTPRPAVVAALVLALEPSRVPRSVLESLAVAVRLYEVPPGRPAFTREEAPRSAWLLLEGQVAIGRSQDARGAQLMRTVKPGQWVDASSCWLDAPPRHDAWVQATARESAWVAELPRDILRTAMAQSHVLAQAWLVVLASQVRQLSETTDELMHQDAEGRCAHWLLQQAQTAGKAASASAPMRVALRERKRTIAAQLGITPETFSRVLRELTRKALIEVDGYNVSLLNLTGLQALATR